ncbi:bifunctional phosphopantothenoylcysteine decarboxylase/phosphopantothenate--cysteine ligase CoaBC [Gilvibacter sediminis]|uniref:bifunctional phosphopantothenoylcysteine decarboxylase/phosphopantothenate--cysteine ligase CoaBC n=1 Tax=Gilvibacter sediminis TaxID=379071 RepID=UPI002350CF9B|nr:bifunctional phosphopantothenoylcysteine decarboxylase/phosphopantothenate--cysteine ligase CoaBC [Gilvibacter sediminis]MDC7997845.1 bifunctional phosphopantothenoylcysteine decarboxylase/phosphopantothenate--cysteine ligase CoaBC [Gilvibacter sediminis]
MSVLKGKRILLGVTAGIAAYKTAWLVRLLVKAEAEVRVVMTPSAKEFVTPLTLSTLSKNEVYSSFTDEEDENARWNNHVELGLWADYLLIAPATANTLAKMANGVCDNLLLAVYLSAKCPVLYAPAMDLDMYKHPSTNATFEKLESFGNIQIPAGHGELASGLVGQGRMAEPEEILNFLEKYIADGLPLRGKKVLITAGPTYEAIDPVRFVGNHSSGLMGYKIAERAADLGAEVTLISGPSHLQLQHALVKIVRVISAQEMLEAVQAHYASAHIGVFAAAVADYRPVAPAKEKIKKTGDTLEIQLEKTQDILGWAGNQKKEQFLVGFALETQNELANAKKKLEKKNLDLIILNSLRDEGAGFKSKTNKVTFIDKNGTILPFELKDKAAVAADILDYIIAQQ